MNPETTVSFTGHRPEKLCDHFSEDSLLIDDIKHLLQSRILTAIDQGYTTFLSGMARGVDIWAGEILAGLMSSFRELKLIAVLPFPEQAAGWEPLWADRHRHLLSISSQVITVEEKYTKDCYLKRNRFLVDNSARLIALCKTETGGTGYTIRYARSLGRELDIIRIPS